ncbi:hypothetical protein AALP_AA7G166300 [Arabis alpina]|uniref:Protein kinase domain-containing protein n=1 Tax=Arabis alpina TaxID=50452 RepID=A0A087GIJ0_ARAAL|nr:hypothetical protein AALP_AA7G166300 [Arabis alpina]
MSYTNTNCFSLFLILFTLLLFLVLYSADLAVSISCKNECGGIAIRFPFGIGNGCYLDMYYEIECRKTTTSRKLVPFLSAIGKEVVSISFYFEGRSFTSGSFGQIRVRTPITSAGCSIDGKDPRLIMNLTGSPFFVETVNYLVAVGCNSKVSLTNIKPSMVGCEVNCNASKESNGNSVPFLDKTGCSSNALSYSNNICTENKPEETRCNGDGCCQVSLPYEPQQVIGIKIESNDGDLTRRREHCRVAFLTDDVYTLSNASKPEELFAKGYSTVSLGWVIQTNNKSFLDSLPCIKNNEYNNASYSVQRETKCICDEVNISKISYANCGCNSGYKGNAYIVGGCADIDECKNEPKYCNDGDTCVNTLGDFHCVRDKTKAILIGIGAGFGVIVIVAGVWWLRKFVIKRRMTKRKKKFFKRNGGLLLQQELNTSEGNVEKTKMFSSKELEKATENFSEKRVLGQGGEGTVYKGMLVDGRTVAVKKSKVIDEDKLQEFINEVVILSQINHRHIVKLLGCCLETEVPILVYESAFLSSFFCKLSNLPQRYQVNKHIARREISSKGTVGYVDPEYYRSSQYTEKSDVYSFGVVLAELITANKPVITVPNTQEVISLVEHFRVAMKKKRLIDIIDVRIRGDCNPEQVMAVANLAMKCLSSKGKNRPNMREVFTELERICTSPNDSHVQIQDEDEDEDEEEVMKIINRGDSWSIGVTAPVVASSSCSDVEPLFPRLTW